MVQIDLEVLVETFLPQIFLLELARFSIPRQEEKWFHETFAAIFGDQVHHTPLHPAFPGGVVKEVLGVKGLVILR